MLEVGSAVCCFPSSVLFAIRSVMFAFPFIKFLAKLAQCWSWGEAVVWTQGPWIQGSGPADSFWMEAGLDFHQIECFAHNLESFGLGTCRILCHSKERAIAGGRCQQESGLGTKDPISLSISSQKCWVWMHRVRIFVVWLCFRIETWSREFIFSLPFNCIISFWFCVFLFYVNSVYYIKQG